MRKTNRRIPAWLSIIFTGFLLSPGDIAAASSAVRAWQEPMTIPTYRVGQPEQNPIFYFGRAYQGARGPVYPYPLLDVLTDTREDRTYSALRLENEYLKICVLPEIGGRIFEAVDKTNGYDFFYRQHVIKPALIGMLGAWISGGVEWNIPHHHRATSFLPVDWTISENPDGSRTVLVGEIELRHRMKWTVGLTLRPGSSVLEVTYRIFNRTPFAHSMLCWANAAVHANENYQVIFPPMTRLATFHGKNQFSHWPISREVYNGVDYTRGVDVSWWKNDPSPTSFFAWESESDFFGGYDHGRDAGIVFVGDHRFSPGKKLWTWGTGSEGARWEKILTDSDGPYLELMFGSFSDNQPDYSWIQPSEVRTVTQFWYPVRGIGGVTNANPQAACFLESKQGLARVGFYTTSPHRAAKATLMAGGARLWERVVEIDPANPLTAEIPLARGVDDESLRLSLSGDDGIELISYRPEKRPDPPLPSPVTPPPAPEKIETNEELYLAGLRLEQCHNPALEPYPYYEEALKRDPGDSRVNAALGRLFLMRGMNVEAEARLRLSVARISHGYTRPKDGESLYYLGLALRALGEESQAMEALARASWSQAWAAASHYQMAEMAAARGDLSSALGSLDRALALNALNTQALDLKATILRHIGRLKGAADCAAASLAQDPLDFWAANERILGRQLQASRADNETTMAELDRLMRGSSQDHLELAVDYGRCGFYDDAAIVLDRAAKRKSGEIAHPMVLYQAAYFAQKTGRPEGALKLRRRASALPADYCFPFRLESIAVLRWAAKEDPGDSRPLLYLGNLLFDKQPRKAIEEWERSRQQDETLAQVHRNLGIAYARVNNDLDAAVRSLAKALAFNPHDPRLYSEWDELSGLAGIHPRERLAVLAGHHEVVARSDDALSREISLLVDVGQYDRAIDLLKSHHFHVWEGGGEIHDVFVDAHLGRGQKFMAEKEYERALQDFRTAAEYPDNLEVGRPARGGRFPEIFYFIGIAHQAMGQSTEAKDSFHQSVAVGETTSELTYYQGLAWRELGDDEKAGAAFESLIRMARKSLDMPQAADYFAKFGEKESFFRRTARLHYLLGLGLLGTGQESEAAAEFRKALGLHPHYSRAQRGLAQIEDTRRPPDRP
jgi:tetratricopeptide (TPR) repeat protein